jgi:hypothetical protein
MAESGSPFANSLISQIKDNKPVEWGFLPATQFFYFHPDRQMKSGIFLIPISSRGKNQARLSLESPPDIRLE